MYDKYLKIFNDYYAKFENDNCYIHRKYEHTFRVVDYAEKIAKSLNLSEKDIEIAKTCALLHDIARFKQITVYHTFEDAKSFDHGDEGYNILKELNTDDEILLLSTKYHNKYGLPELNERVKMFVNITRDADKLDIMIVNGLKCSDKEYNVDKAIIDSFKNHKQLRVDVINYNSSILVIISGQ